MNARALIPLVAGLGIGGLALKMGLDTLRSAKGAQKPVASVQVWGAKQDILRGDEVGEEMLKLLEYPSSLVPEGAIKDKEQIVGRVCTLDTPGELPLLERNLLPPGEQLRLTVKPGYRAVSVKIDESSGVDYHLEPGCRVDVIGSFAVRRDGARQETIATTIVENVEVAAVGERITPTTGKAEEDASHARRKVRAVTLFVKPEHVPKLHVTEEKGHIKLALRGDGDDGQLAFQEWTSHLQLTGEDRAEEEESRPEAVLAAAPQPVVPAPPIVESWRVDVYRGGSETREEVVFEREIEPAPGGLIQGALSNLMRRVPGPQAGPPGGAPQPEAGNGAFGVGSSVSGFLSSVFGKTSSEQGKTPPVSQPQKRKPGDPLSPEELRQEGPVEVPEPEEPTE